MMAAGLLKGSQCGIRLIRFKISPKDMLALPYWIYSFGLIRDKLKNEKECIQPNHEEKKQ